MEASELLKVFKAWDVMTPEQKQQVIDFYTLPAADDDDHDYADFDDHYFSE